MGVSFAKSVKFGAVRFNFSGGGIGMSVGIPGLRIGTGPRGAYIGGGMAGFRYRKSLGPGSKRRLVRYNQLWRRDTTQKQRPNPISSPRLNTRRRPFLN